VKRHPAACGHGVAAGRGGGGARTMAAWHGALAAQERKIRLHCELRLSWRQRMRALTASAAFSAAASSWAGMVDWLYAALVSLLLLPLLHLLTLYTLPSYHLCVGRYSNALYLRCSSTATPRASAGCCGADA